jgi:phosphoribosylformimino-5-aminoimidazole carboxamide ribotide isomerase
MPVPPRTFKQGRKSDPAKLFEVINMEIYPAIDIINGKCVRLSQGKFDKETRYGIDPVDYAKSLADAGAKWIHIVDLDGARQGTFVQKEIIKNVVKAVPVNIQLGGGICSKEIINDLLNMGVARVVIGTKAVSDPETTKEWISGFGSDQITFAFDVSQAEGEYMVAVKGWKELSAISLWSIMDEYKDISVFNVLCTDIKKDGMLSGPDLGLYKRILAKYPNVRLQLSGGVGSLDDLKGIRDTGVSAIIVGKALYEKRFTLQDAIEVIKK